jgi:choline dehydrogenase
MCADLVGKQTGPEVKPGANYTTDAQLLEYIRTKGIGAVHHASSTNKMGLANDTMAVVDSHGKVFGVKNLRVIDSSSFRFTPPGHTQGATCKSFYAGNIVGSKEL